MKLIENHPRGGGSPVHVPLFLQKQGVCSVRHCFSSKKNLHYPPLIIPESTSAPFTDQEGHSTTCFLVEVFGLEDCNGAPGTDIFSKVRS